VAGLAFQIQLPDGRTEDFLVDSDRVIVGSGAHCEIRLPPEHASVEHVVVSLSGANVHAEARVLDPAPTINGTPFAQAPLLVDAVLGVGGVQIRVRPEDVANQANVIRKKDEPTSPLTYVLAAVAVPISLFILFDDPPDDDAGAMPADRPALFATDGASCPQTSAVESRALAQTKRRLAESKRERGPFHVQDAVAAVPLYAEARACFESAGETDAAKDMVDAGAKLRASLEEEYRARQVRLEHALGVKDLRTAQRETRLLLGMLEGRSEPYVAWLGSVERRIALKLGKPGTQ
jgi:hypothetical protein